MNVVVLVGRLARDPEIRYTNSGMAVCSATIAVDRNISREDRDAGKQSADFIRLSIFGKQGETFSRYLTKGRQVAVEGRIQTGSYQNQKGETVYTTDVVVNRFDFIGSRDDAQQGGFAGNSGFGGGSQGFSRPQAQPAAVAPSEVPEGFEAIDDDDIPF